MMQMQSERQEDINMENRIICNCCGREIRTDRGIGLEDYLNIKKEWGYFSKKDGRRQEFCLCEACYDEIVGRFRIPVTDTEMTELI